MVTSSTFSRSLRMQQIAYLALLISSLILPGCSKDDNPTQPVAASGPPNELVATWTAQSAFVGGTPALLSNALDWRTGTVRATFSYASNYAFTYTEYSSSNSPLQITTGTFMVSNGVIAMKLMTDNGQAMIPAKDITSAYTLVGSVLNLTWTTSHGTYTIQSAK